MTAWMVKKGGETGDRLLVPFFRRALLVLFLSVGFGTIVARAAGGASSVPRSPQAMDLWSGIRPSQLFSDGSPGDLRILFLFNRRMVGYLKSQVELQEALEAEGEPPPTLGLCKGDWAIGLDQLGVRDPGIGYQASLSSSALHHLYDLEERTGELSAVYAYFTEIPESEAESGDTFYLPAMFKTNPNAAGSKKKKPAHVGYIVRGADGKLFTLSTNVHHSAEWTVVPVSEIHAMGRPVYFFRYSGPYPQTR